MNISSVSTDAQLYAIWPKIREGINAMEGLTDGLFYRPEDVYHELKLQRATLLVGEVDGEYQGFMVIKDYPYPDGKGLFIWIMYHATNSEDFVSEFMDAVKAMGNKLGIIRYCISDARKGWDRWAQRKGFKKTTVNHYEFVG